MPTKPKPYRKPEPKVQQWSANEDKFYHSAKWRNLRKLVLSLYPICVHCKEKNITTLSKVADHIKPVRLGGQVWDINNLQGLCESCHNIKSAKESKI
jgi:5-methylcytosine-specific restriction protein A